MPNKKHVLITCYDPRIDSMVADFIDAIRAQGDILAGKNVMRPPGGVHLFTGKSNHRSSFYDIVTFYRDEGIDRITLLPHTNCYYCGTHLMQKIGNGTRSDLGFHIKSAEKILEGARRHFANAPAPELDARIILTVDQRIVSIEEARELLPHIPEHHEHGAPCCSHHRHHHSAEVTVTA